MEYYELMNMVFDDFYINEKEYPQDLLYPVLVENSDGVVFDLFMACNLTRNVKDGSIENIDEPYDFYLYNIIENNGKFIKNYESQYHDSERLHVECNVSINEFNNLYMKLRWFAFESELSSEQIDVLRKTIKIYDDLFDSKVSSIYHKYGSVFFAWANKILKQNK